MSAPLQPTYTITQRHCAAGVSSAAAAATPARPSSLVVRVQLPQLAAGSAIETLTVVERELYLCTAPLPPTASGGAADRRYELRARLPYAVAATSGGGGGGGGGAAYEAQFDAARCELTLTLRVLPAPPAAAAAATAVAAPVAAEEEEEEEAPVAREAVPLPPPSLAAAPTGSVHARWVTASAAAVPQPELAEALQAVVAAEAAAAEAAAAAAAAAAAQARTAAPSAASAAGDSADEALNAEIVAALSAAGDHELLPPPQRARAVCPAEAAARAGLLGGGGGGCADDDAAGVFTGRLLRGLSGNLYDAAAIYAAFDAAVLLQPRK